MALVSGVGDVKQSAARGRGRAFCWCALLALLASVPAEVTAIQVTAQDTVFIYGDPMGELQIDIADADTLDAGSEMWVKIPAELDLSWDTESPVSVEGRASDKVGTVRFSEDARTLAIPITADFGSTDVVTLTGWHPDPSQPQPARPGSASASLAEALGTAEKSTGEKPGS